jgi:hypothetical protein
MARKTTFRENRFRIGAMVGAAVLGVFVALFLVPAVAGRSVNVWISLAGALIALVIFVPVMLLSMKLGDRLIVKDRIEVAMRKAGTTKWRHGRLTVTPGHLSIQPYRWQVRLPKGKPIEMDVDTMTEDTGRRPSLKQLLTVNPQLHIVELESSSGRLEIAGAPSHLSELRERLHEQADT